MSNAIESLNAKIRQKSGLGDVMVVAPRLPGTNEIDTALVSLRWANKQVDVSLDVANQLIDESDDIASLEAACLRLGVVPSKS